MNASVLVEFACGLHPGVPVEQLPPMAVLKGYFDESEDRSLFTLAGWIAPQSTWDAFDQPWRLMLDGAPHEVKAFHTAHLVHRRKDFGRKKDWTREECDKLISDATDLLCTDEPWTQKLYAVGCTAVLAELPKLSIHEIYEHCFGVCLNLMICGFPDVLAEGNTFDLFFDEKDKMRDRVGGWIESCRSEPLWGERIGSWRFGSDENVLPLQAADLLAWERRRRTYDRLHRPRRKPRPNYLNLRRARRGHFQLLDRSVGQIAYEYSVIKRMGLPARSLVGRIPCEPD